MSYGWIEILVHAGVFLITALILHGLYWLFCRVKAGNTKQKAIFRSSWLLSFVQRYLQVSFPSFWINPKNALFHAGLAAMLTGPHSLRGLESDVWHMDVQRNVRFIVHDDPRLLGRNCPEPSPARRSASSQGSIDGRQAASVPARAALTGATAVIR